MSRQGETAVDQPLLDGNIGHRSTDFYKRATWFDETGHYVGSGAITVGQPEAQSRALHLNEARIIVPGRVIDDWQPALVDRLQHRHKEAPGFHFLAKEFVMVITKNKVHLANDGREWIEAHGDNYETLKRKELCHFIATVASQKEVLPNVLFTSRRHL